MFNKKYKALEERIRKIEENKADYRSCESCKCHLDTEDCKKITKEQKEYISLGFGGGYQGKTEAFLFYCPKCAPEYEIVDAMDEKAIRYYKTVAEHRLEVKVK